MNNKNKEETLFEQTIRLITGAGSLKNGPAPLGGNIWRIKNLKDLENELAELFTPVLPAGIHGDEIKELLKNELKDAVDNFEAVHGNTAITVPKDREEAAKVISEIWTPEIAMDSDDITDRWKLKDVHENPDPIKADQVVLQLNALYTLPETAPPDEQKKAWQALALREMQPVADYDHPVPIFCPEDEHELIKCLRELDSDMEFEKEKAVIPLDWKVPVLISVSVTHDEITEITGIWLRKLLSGMEFKNIRCMLLTESDITHLKETLFTRPHSVFTVSGKYSNHFNALKYTQLLLEKGYGIRGGFKLDTDEGIRSKELHHATGKTWMQTLCHSYWGGRARDWKGRKYFLDVNEGEYMDSRDIERLGYTGSLREPDVKLPSSRQGAEIFFWKQIAHARTTALYNGYDLLEDFISHPVVKGGGYGITNEGLKRAVPFTYSRAGRAEDQMFYFSALSRGVRGIFHPDLRIAHYKSSVSASEEKTEASRFIGDMYRLLLFKYLVDELGVKDDIDPMPGIFAGPMARSQYLFHLLYKAWDFHLKGKTETAGQLLLRGLPELKELKDDIDSGIVGKELHREHRDWKHFIKEISLLPGDAVRKAMDELFI